MKFFLLFIVVFSFASEAFSQAATLPRGVGLIQYSYRNLSTQKDTYDSSGNLVSLSEIYDQELSLNSALGRAEGSGALGGLIGDINLGEIDIDAQGSIDVNILAIGYGITDKITAYFAVPYIRASVESELRFNPQGPASALKDAVGNALPGQLGDRITNSRVITPELIRQQLANEGYTLEDRWEYEGIGDIQFGLKTAFDHRIRRGLGFNLGLGIDYYHPTGYVDDPNILNDSNLGEGGEAGYAGIALNTQPGFIFRNFLYVGGDFIYRHNLTAKIAKRIPEGDEPQPGQDRLIDATVKPGKTTISKGIIKLTHKSFYSTYHIGYFQHDKDDISGPISGNYAALEALTEREKVFQGVRFGMQTVKAYERGKFPIPLDISGGYQFTSSGTNSPNDAFLDITITTFFPTPFMRALPKKRRARAS